MFNKREIQTLWNKNEELTDDIKNIKDALAIERGTQNLGRLYGLQVEVPAQYYSKKMENLFENQKQLRKKLNKLYDNLNLEYSTEEKGVIKKDKEDK